jgi:hypothetical protein
MAPERAIAEIVGGTGTQFSPPVVAAFERLCARGSFTVAGGRALLASLFALDEEE